jgi:putative Mg2+ transporter-C (MgtC) family protein
MEAIIEDLASGHALPAAVVAFRLIGAAALCAVIGMEREWTNHPAGLRTHIMIGIGTALFALVMQGALALFAEEPRNVDMDPIRLLQAIGAAVGFLAAGVVVFAKGEVRGLTTGAGIWVAAGVGLAAGLGFWLMALLTAALALVVNLGLKPFEDWINRG